MDSIRGEMFSDGYGFVVDYLAEILRSLRNDDYSDRYKAFFSLSSDISIRDKDGIHKTFSGLMKILHPDGTATDAEIEELLRLSMEGRKRVKDQLLRIDSTFHAVRFAYSSKAGKECLVTTLEEDEYPNYYNKTGGVLTEAGLPDAAIKEAAAGTNPRSGDTGEHQPQPSDMGVERPLKEKPVSYTHLDVYKRQGHYWS